MRLAAPAALQGRNVGWFAPNYKYLEEPWNDLRRVLGPLADRINKTERVIELKTRGVIDFWTLDDEDAGRGRRYHIVIIDEAGLIKGLEKRWYEAIRPTLMDFQGEAWMLGTPKGMNFFAAAYNMGQDPLDPDWASWRMPTWTNTKIPDLEAEIEAARKELPERAFQQEIEALFLEDGGGVFRRIREAVEIGRTANQEPESGRIYTLGVDLARVEDFTVLSVMDDKGRQVFHERFNQISWERQKTSIAAVAKKYRAGIVMDATGVGDPIYEDLRGLGLRVQPFIFTNQSKEHLIDNLAMHIEQGRVSLMDIEAQTNELVAFQYELTPSRHVTMSAPEGMHDDCVIALALSCWPLKQAPQPNGKANFKKYAYV